MLRISRTLLPVVIAIVAYTALTGTSSADTTSPYWTCRATVGYIGPPEGPKFEPMIAHADPKAPCANDDAGQTDPPPLTSDQGRIVAQTVYAGTLIKPAVSSSDLQSVASLGQVTSLRIENGDGSFTMTADVTKAGVTGSCNGGVPAFATEGGVTKAVVNGTQVSPDEQSTYTEAGNQFNGSPFGGVIRVFFNEVVTSGTTTEVDQTAIRRAVHVQILDGGNNVIFEAVAGEAFAGRHGPVCQAGPRCPAGAVYDPARGVCVIREEVKGECPPDAQREGNVCVRTVVVGPAGPGTSTGGQVVPLGQVLGYRGPCKNKRFGSQVAIIGSKKADRITGSNKSDRIFVFEANDRVSGGRGNDCIEGGEGSDRLEGSTGLDWILGGAGNDQISGAQATDYLYGGDGNDVLIGGSGNDHLFGGKGRNRLDGGKGSDLIIGGPDRDYIIGGNGRDRIRAGAGNDDVNVAAAGAVSRVDCGAGMDTVRINNNELKSTRNCERILVTTRLQRLKSYDKAYKKNKKKKK